VSAADSALTRPVSRRAAGARPTFPGAVRGEILKVSRQRTTWVMLGVALLFFSVFALALLSAPGVRNQLHQDPRAWFYTMLDILLSLFDTGSGIFLLVVSARLVGMEYSAGTIRVLLARGTGRLRLLAAKLTALAIGAVLLLASFALLAGAVVSAMVQSWEGSLRPLSSLPAEAWRYLELQFLVALISLGVCLLLGTAAAVVGRSLAFGLSAALAFFPSDNFGTIVLSLLNRLTGKDFWNQLSAYLLGPNLNQLPALLEPHRLARAAFATPLVKIDATHSLVVVGVYSAIFLTASLVLTWRRDVLE
jgi:ABC-type transport system involved in multi-copper enzyme maturation permease subunit